MSTRQPDHRIKQEELKFFRLDKKVFVIHGRPGCPRNACIEEFDGFLRCWACYNPLTDRAARYVRNNFEKTDNGAFIVRKVRNGN